MATTLTRAEAAAALAERAAERDRIQANLDDLDGNFGRRLLAGAKLAGVTETQWESAAADMAAILDAFNSYSAVVQQATEILDGTRRPYGPLLPVLTKLLTGPSVVLASPDVPLAQRELTGSRRPEEYVTLDLAVQRMTAAFSRVIKVVNAAEVVWTECSRRLNEISDALGATVQQAAEVGDESLRTRSSAVDAELRRLRALLNSDPLALWEGGNVVISGLDQLLDRARAVASQTTELMRLRADADMRIAEVSDRVGKARACEQDARELLKLAEQKIVAEQLPLMPAATDDLTERLDQLNALRSADRLQRLATEIAAIEKDAAAAAKRWQEADAAAQALLDRRTELRGLLDAYQAKAGHLGAAEDPGLTRHLEVARDLLWSAPCDLAASADAVRSYQLAVLAVQRGPG